MRSNESQREARKKEKIEKELKTAKNELENKTLELKTKHSQLQRSQEEIAKLEQQLKEQRVRPKMIINISDIYTCHFEHNTNCQCKVSYICM